MPCVQVACTKEDLELLGMTPEQRFVVAQQPGHCLMAFAENATALDKLEALAGGCLLQRYHARTAKSGKLLSAEEVGSQLMPVAEAVQNPTDAAALCSSASTQTAVPSV